MWQKILLDSGSEANLVTKDFFKFVRPREVGLGGLHATQSVSEDGEASILIGHRTSVRAVKVHCLKTKTIASGKVALLLSATVAKTLGFIASELYGMDIDIGAMTELDCEAGVRVIILAVRSLGTFEFILSR